MPNLPAVAKGVEIPLRSVRYGLSGESMAEDAYFTEWHGEPYVCPRTPRLRVLQGVLAVRRSYGHLGGRVIPESVAREARKELAGLHAQSPGIRPSILTSAWHVPMRWFVPFAPSQRELGETDGRFTIRYRTDYIAAMARLDQAIMVLEGSSIPDSVAAEVGELKNWLGDFGVDSMLELDYGTVADMFSNADLLIDESAADVWKALDAIEDGVMEEAGISYQRMVARWSQSMAVSYSN